MRNGHLRAKLWLHGYGEQMGWDLGHLNRDPDSLRELARTLRPAWTSRVLSVVGGANVKVIRMDGTSWPAEAHLGNEVLIVIEGQMRLKIDGDLVVISSGEVLVVPAGVPHSVEPDSTGTLVSVIE